MRSASVMELSFVGDDDVRRQAGTQRQVVGEASVAIIGQPESTSAYVAHWRPTLSGGGGIKVHLDDRIYVIGEMRLLGIGTNCSASSAEYLGGIRWSLW